MGMFSNDEIKQAMAAEGLDMDDARDCRKYADLLDRDLVHVPKSLDQIVYSRNGKCEWYLWKDFVNYYKHEINFSAVSRLFEDPLPFNYEIIYEEWDEHSTERPRPDGSFDSRDRLVAKLDANHYVVVKVDPQYTGSGKVRIVTAFYADKATVEAAKLKRYQSGSNELFQALVRINDVAYDYFEGVPEYSGDITKLAAIFSGYRSSDLTVLEVANKLIEAEPSLSVKQADVITHNWMGNKNIEFILKVMSRI